MTKLPFSLLFLLPFFFTPCPDKEYKFFTGLKFFPLKITNINSTHSTCYEMIEKLICLQQKDLKTSIISLFACFQLTYKKLEVNETELILTCYSIYILKEENKYICIYRKC